MMKRIIQGVKRGVASDLRRQFILPTKSLVGEVATRYWDKQNQLLVERLISKLEINSDSKVLEIGYGRGHGLKVCHSVIKEGAGTTFGIEASSYMMQRALDRFRIEMLEERSITLDMVTRLNNLPYPTNIFDAVYHVDVFYFWTPKDLHETCKELLRVLKPGGRLICGMELKRLKNLENYGILKEEQYDPMRYMVHLEPMGFKDVKIEYENLSPDREIQLISARKPGNSEDDLDPEAEMKKLERRIKQFMAMQSLMESEQPNPEIIRQAAGEEKKPSSASSNN